MSLQFLQNALLNKNTQAYLITIRHSEGTDAPDGYNYIFGSSPSNTRRFTSFSEHPDIKVPFGKDNFSTAAGAYQILFKTWESIRIKYALPDFSPASQDNALAQGIAMHVASSRLIEIERTISICIKVQNLFIIKKW
jgi:muramidase (phage lysozyme)